MRTVLGHSKTEGVEIPWIAQKKRERLGLISPMIKISSPPVLYSNTSARDIRGENDRSRNKESFKHRTYSSVLRAREGENITLPNIHQKQQTLLPPSNTYRTNIHRNTVNTNIMVPATKILIQKLHIQNLLKKQERKASLGDNRSKPPERYLMSKSSSMNLSDEASEIHTPPETPKYDIWNAKTQVKKVKEAQTLDPTPQITSRLRQLNLKRLRCLIQAKRHGITPRFKNNEGVTYSESSIEISDLDDKRIDLDLGKGLGLKMKDEIRGRILSMKGRPQRQFKTSTLKISRNLLGINWGNSPKDNLAAEKICSGNILHYINRKLPKVRWAN